MSNLEVIEQIKAKTMEIDTFLHVDISELQCPIIAIYIHPEDYPEAAVARVFDLDKPTNIIIVRENEEELRNDIMNAYPWMQRFIRAKNDPESILETWI